MVGQIETPSRRRDAELYSSNISSADSSTSSQIRTRNTFIEVFDEIEEVHLGHVKSSRSHSMPELVSKEQQRDLATILLEQMRTSGLPGTRDITMAICATVENMLPMNEAENWSNDMVYRLIRDRGFDATNLIKKVEILSSFGKVKLKFVDHASLVSFKLLFDQSSFDGVSPCCVKIVDCCCGESVGAFTGGAPPPVAEPPPLEILLQKKPNPPVPSPQINLAQESNRLFVGGLSPDTTDSSLRAHFEPYGELVEAAVILDKRSKQSRGFGFIAFAFGRVPVNILSDEHVIDGKAVGIRIYGKGRE